MCAANLAYNISLLWSSCLYFTLSIYKHFAPLELKRLVPVSLRLRNLRIVLVPSAVTHSYRSRL